MDKLICLSLFLILICAESLIALCILIPILGIEVMLINAKDLQNDEHKDN